MPALPKCLFQISLWKFLARKEKCNFTIFVANWHAIRKRILQRCPADVHAKIFIYPGSRAIEALVVKRLLHISQLHLRRGTRHFCDKTEDTGHALILRSHRSLKPAFVPELSQLTE